MFIHCPHCDGSIEIVEFNCCIFRHGILKTTGEQIDPHANQSACEYFVENNLIYGCGKPFRVLLSGETWTAEVCDYI
jgi:hypothetical protein